MLLKKGAQWDQQIIHFYNPNEGSTCIFDMHSKTYHNVADLFVHIKKLIDFQQNNEF